jgi:hypothetical protein
MLNMSEELSESPYKFEKFTIQDFGYTVIGGLGGMVVGCVGNLYVDPYSNSNTSNQPATLHYQQATLQEAKLHGQINGLKTLQADAYPLSGSPDESAYIARVAEQDIIHKQHQIHEIEASTVQPKPPQDSKAGAALDIFFGATAIGAVAGALVGVSKRFIKNRRMRRAQTEGGFLKNTQAAEQADELEAWFKL